MMELSQQHLENVKRTFRYSSKKYLIKMVEIGDLWEQECELLKLEMARRGMDADAMYKQNIEEFRADLKRRGIDPVWEK